MTDSRFDSPNGSPDDSTLGKPFGEPFGEPLTIQEISRILDATLYTKQANCTRQIGVGCTSDLMSDVLAFSLPRSILITGLNTPQTVRTAEVADLAAICLAFGKVPDQTMIELAEESGIPLMTTPLSPFSASGRLFARGIGGCAETR